MLACAAPNPSIDKLFATARVVPGDIHRPSALHPRPGGKGLNVARAAHALGADVRAIALLAGHAGAWIAEALEADGIAVDAVDAPGETRSSLSVLAEDTGALTEFYEAGDEETASAWPAFCARAAASAAGASWLTLSGSLPRGVDPASCGELVRAARAAGARVAVDQDGAALEAALAASPDVVKVNATEAGALTGVDDPVAAAADLARRAGPGSLVVVTLGADGALLRAPDGASWRGDLPERGPYAVGSGDAVLAGLVTALERDPGDVAWALAAGLGAGTANALEAGAGSLDPDRARALAAAARGRLERV